MLTIENVSASYGGAPLILDDISFTVSKGEVVALIGPSGTGKSTLLNAITTLHQQYQGTITLDRADINPKHHKIAWIPQNYGLLPWETVKENILLGVSVRKLSGKTISNQLDHLVSELGLGELLLRYPNQLSGGQQQRVAIARAMLVTPDIFLLDEPFSALDALTREHMQSLFLTQWDKEKAPAILITHDVEEAVFMASKIVLLSGKPGRVSAVIENSSFSIPLKEKRLSPLFYDTIKQVRGAMEKA
ncbi:MULTISPECIES: ABC transporter ATP-binding protein [unclassified Vagococcus]|uniref:ABC transporter ATP-binding protein n=1 Tax=unclassified Vagococcus TaxID=2648499 RepID=UPI001F50888A|nr:MULTISPECIES: ABC transporter ATP-binding protein [unclassified Vagococcus]MCI0130954.1 ABC transporter ATP-binding protein [Vagococcus sp. CY53-2]UNM89338.1 ABC transporter ATP-binding protein [Vagococcus sp. CY52-2]